ncbi:hypothetical protein FRB90_004020 [Tulasnella sp. 427]|nr:hypothetical protein FRB90_004020 [Tulasnella sp. 427]
MATEPNSNPDYRPLSYAFSDSPPSSFIARRSLSMQPSRLREVINADDDADDVAVSHASSSPPASQTRSSSSSSSSDGHVFRPINAYRPIDHSPPSSSAPGSRRNSPPSSSSSHSPRVLSTAPSWNSRVLLLGEAPGLPSLPYSQRGSFYSHMTREFDERNPFTSPRAAELQEAIYSKFKFSSDPSGWSINSFPAHAENDDSIHDPSAPDPTGFAWADCFSGTLSELFDVGLAVCLGEKIKDAPWKLNDSSETRSIAYPVATYVRHPSGFALGINATGQVPTMVGNFGLIDKDTPKDAYTVKSSYDGSELQLVFSDEFNVDGRTFYPGDDPFWEAVDLHYWQTNNLEWYSPDAITTSGGSLLVTLSETPTHNLDYQSAMSERHNSNQFCFTGGYIEASVRLPGTASVGGLWPAIWTMGNLGRAGYGASLDGMWPYTYDSCDAGTLPNQTYNGQPELALTGGSKGKPLSYLPGQRLSACTCGEEGETDHPGPRNKDGTWVGRNVPEIDIFEAQTSKETGLGQVSQSAQFAPFDMYYLWNNGTDAVTVYDTSLTSQNSFSGNTYQEAASLLTTTDQNCYQNGGTGCYSVYGFEYKGGGDGYISWVSNSQPAWTMNANAIPSNGDAIISQRLISQEPMYMILNLGLSHNFGTIDFDELSFPAIMAVDYIRVYQNKNSVNIGCDPQGFPTSAYIAKHIDAYTNANLTTWDQYGGTKPPNRLINADQCPS